MLQRLVRVLLLMKDIRKQIPSQNADERRRQQKVGFCQPLYEGSENLQIHIWAFLSVLIAAQSAAPAEYMRHLGLEELVNPEDRRNAIKNHFTGHLKDGKSLSEHLSLEDCLHLGDFIMMDMAAQLRLWFGHRLFLTEHGDIGIGPETLQLGDEISVLVGCRSPAILRSSGPTTCILVSHLYLALRI
jgi:hypothetical protein